MKSSKVKGFFANYFDSRLDIHVQAFHLLAFAGIAVGIIIAAISFMQNAGIIGVIFNLFASVMAVLLLWLTVKKRVSYRFASWVVVVVVFMVVFPFLFFEMGGYRSGMPSFFILALLFTAILLDGVERFAAVAVELALYVVCCLAAYFYPQLAKSFAAEAFYVSDVITGIVVSGLLLLLVILLYIRLYRVREAQIHELNHELAARNETLVKYDKMKSDFLAAVAHEISTPLTAISGSSADTMELLKESPVNMVEISENHRRIEKKVMQIDSIVTELMDTVAIENGRLSLSRHLLELPEFLKSVCDASFKLLDKNNNRLTYGLQTALPSIWIDPGRIEQVMTNLISNSVRHTKDGVVTIKLTRANNCQIVSVIDNGEGMTPELAASALKKYYSSTGDNQYWRHGYGLYVSRQIILSHGGDIWVESEKGIGTTVSFTLMEEDND